MTRDRFCKADFLGSVRIFLATTIACECEYQKRMIAHILFHMETADNTLLADAGDHDMHDMHDMHKTLQYLFQYKAWANDELLTALAGLGAESPITKLAIKALSHTYIVDQIFAAHLRRKDHAYTSANLSQMPRLEELSADIRTSDREYVGYVSALARDQLADRIDFVFTDGAQGRMSREEMLMHVITHGVGHRGQVSAVMLLNSATPPKDGFTTYLHNAEALTRRRTGA